MKEPGFKSKGDFLTMMLEDELFADSSEEMAIDEGLSLLIAAT